MRKLMLVAAAALAAQVFGAIRAVTPVAWDGNAKCWQMGRHAQKMKEIAAGGAPVVFIGDSITHFWEGNGRATWERYFAKGPRRALNLGTSADRTEHVLWRLTAGGELDGYEAKCILLMIGTNNSGHFPFAQEPPVDTVLGIREILNVIRAKQPKARVILTAIFPRGGGPADGCRRRNDVVNKEIAKFADGRHVIWCDFSDKFLAADGTLSPELFPDLLHPGPRGYEIWASAVVPLIDRVLAAGPDEAIPSVWPSSPSTYLPGPLEAQPVAAFPDANWWGTRCLEKRNEIVANGPVSYDLVMLGDSITHRWERADGEGRALFAEMRKSAKILNLGYGGDRVENLIWRLENGELEGYTARWFSVMIGTNNPGNNPAAVAAGVKRVLAILRAKHPEAKILLSPIFPRGASAADARRVRNDKVNALIKGFADGKTVVWQDFTARLLDANGDTKALMDDRLHPNARGYEIWREALAPYLGEQKK